MPPPAQPEPPANVYSGVYHVLLGGMALSTLLFALGVARALQHPVTLPLDPQWIRQFYHWGYVYHGLLALDPTALMLAATALLILTPIARVAVSLVAFWMDRDYKYVAVTGIVLAVIALTIVLAHFGLH